MSASVSCSVVSSDTASVVASVSSGVSNSGISSVVAVVVSGGFTVSSLFFPFIAITTIPIIRHKIRAPATPSTINNVVLFFSGFCKSGCPGPPGCPGLNCGFT